MSLYSRIINKTEPKDLKRNYFGTNHQVFIVTFGIFETQTSTWKYYLTSCIDRSNQLSITCDVCKLSGGQEVASATIGSIQVYGRPLKTPEEGIKWAEEFKMKWESGSNDLLSEVRDKKLEEILNK